MRMTIALLIAALPVPAGAQTTMYKCMDEQKRVTYSNIPCEKQGLKSDGTVTNDRVTTMPLGPAGGKNAGPAPLPTQKLSPPPEPPKAADKK